MTQRVVSGIKPTGNLHLGNYLGAVKQWVAMQDQVQASGGETLYFIADLHGLTEWIAPADLRAQTIEMTATLVAAGIDPDRSILFNQTRVPAHSELTWLLNNVARVGWLNRMTQFKDKAGRDREQVSAGLYIYPCLMAADILAYKATRVPVGDDQRQHLELANDIAQKFNHDYGVEFFPAVEALIGGPAARVMSLRDGTKKMSKSDPSDQSRINLTDDADTIALKIRRARTDAEPLPSEPAGLVDRAEARNLVGIMAAMQSIDAATVLATHGGQGFGVFKDALADVVVTHLGPIAAETRRLLADPGTVDRVLQDGAARASALADPIVREAERLVGFLQA